MKNFRFPAFFFALTVILSSVPAQAQVVNDNFYNVFNVAAALKDGRGARNQTVSPDRQIKNIQSFHEKSGVAYTSDIVFRTDSDGKHWREIALPKKANEKISAVYFENDNIGSAILADSARAVLILAKTVDGGDSWTREAQNSIFAQAPGGSTRISLNRGFDKCTAATVAQMQTWWNNFAVLRCEYLHFGQKSRLLAAAAHGRLGQSGFGDGLGLDSDDRRLSSAVLGQH
jgi:hypothetical protein